MSMIPLRIYSRDLTKMVRKIMSRLQFAKWQLTRWQMKPCKEIERRLQYQYYLRHCHLLSLFVERSDLKSEKQ